MTNVVRLFLTGENRLRVRSLDGVMVRWDEKDANKEITVVEEREGAGGAVERVTYTKGRFLGKGGFASVYEFREDATGRVYAGKVVPFASLTSARRRAKLATEIQIQASLRHRHVVRLERSFADADSTYIVMELCPHSTLLDMLKHRKRVLEAEARYWMRQLLDAVEYMHARLVIHRDLKLGNFFVADGMVLKVGDFGLAAQLRAPGERKRSLCGTPNYIAPELLEPAHEHSFQADVWSLGVVLYTLLYGRPPFERRNVRETYALIQRNQFAFPPDVPTGPAARALISAILQLDPARRPSVAAIRAHPFFAEPTPRALPLAALRHAPALPADITPPDALRRLPAPAPDGATEPLEASPANRLHRLPNLPAPRGLTSAGAGAGTALALHSEITATSSGAVTTTTGATGGVTTTKATTKITAKTGLPVPDLLPSLSSASSKNSHHHQEQQQLQNQQLQQHRQQQQQQGEKTKVHTIMGLKRAFTVTSSPARPATRGTPHTPRAPHAQNGTVPASPAWVVPVQRRTIVHASVADCVTDLLLALPAELVRSATATLAKSSTSSSGGAAARATAATLPLTYTSSASMALFHEQQQRQPVLFVRQWCDAYTADFGVGYQLSDGAVGGFFNDGSRMLRRAPPRAAAGQNPLSPVMAAYVPDDRGTLETFAFPAASARDPATGDYPRLSHDMSKKAFLLGHFERSFKPVNLAPPPPPPPSKRLRSDDEAQGQGHQQQPPPPVLVSWCWRSALRRATIFLLSNGVLQMNFADRVKLLLVPWWPLPRVRPIDADDTAVLELRPDTPVSSACVPPHLSPYVKELCLFLVGLRQRFDRNRSSSSSAASSAAPPPASTGGSTVGSQAPRRPPAAVGVGLARL